MTSSPRPAVVLDGMLEDARDERRRADFAASDSDAARIAARRTPEEAYRVFVDILLAMEFLDPNRVPSRALTPDRVALL